METTFKVKIWSVETCKGKNKSTYRVRWIVETNRFGEMFNTVTLANNFRSKLVLAASRGEEFEISSGLPLSLIRERSTMSWFQFACVYIDMKWADSSPKYRKSLVESLVSISLPLLENSKGISDQKLLRRSLTLAYNCRTRNLEHLPEINAAIKLIKKSIKNVSELADPDVLRSVLRALDLRLDGQRASLNTVRIKRVTLNDAINFAVEKELLTKNSLKEIKVKKRKFGLKELNPETVINPAQFASLLDGVRHSGKNGPRYVAFFGLMYFAALRPEEAANLKKSNLLIPPPTFNEKTGEQIYGWGDIRLEKSRPEIGSEWTNSGEAGEESPLKHRELGEERTVPCPPPLTKLLHEHLDTFGTAQDGRLFRGTREGGRIGSSVYGRMGATARQEALGPELANSSLAKRPYDLRHAAVSTWLSSGVEATRVAKWAGHSLSVLLTVYAKCIDGGEQAARDRVAQTLEIKPL